MREIPGLLLQSVTLVVSQSVLRVTSCGS